LQNEIIVQYIISLIIAPWNVEICPPPALKWRQFASIPHDVCPGAPQDLLAGGGERDGAKGKGSVGDIERDGKRPGRGKGRGNGDSLAQ